MLIIPGPSGAIEAITTAPEREKESHVLHLNIICHPHPLYGGTMHNKVITTLVRTFSELGEWSLRFNFRGVGASEGIYDHGKGELEDLLAVIRWAQIEFPEHSLCLSGFSFGAYIALQGAAHPNVAPRVKRLVTIAPAIQHVHFPEQADIRCPWLLMMGEEDELVPVEEVKHWVQKQTSTVDTVYLPHTGHFFHGKLTLLRESLKTSLKHC